MSEPAPSSAPWWQFSLRWIFVATALVAVVCGYFVRNWRRQVQVEALIAELERRGHETSDADYGEARPEPTWTSRLFGYPSLQWLKIEPEDRDFGSFPWDAVMELGDMDFVMLDHPQLRDEHLIRLAQFPRMRTIEVTANPNLTDAGLGALARCDGLKEVVIDALVHPLGSWRFLDSLKDESHIWLHLRPEQYSQAVQPLRGKKGLDLFVYRFKDAWADAGPERLPYPADSPLEPGMLREIGLHNLVVTVGWMPEDDVVELIEQNRNLETLEVAVDCVSTRLLPALQKAEPRMKLSTLEIDERVLEAAGRHKIQIPRLTPSLAAALRRGRGELEILVPSTAPLPEDMSGLTVSGDRGQDWAVIRTTPPPPTVSALPRDAAM